MMDVIMAAIGADVPVILWGPPGTGKTAVVLEMAGDAGAHVEVVIGAQIDPADVGGLPVPLADGTIVMAPPPWARRIRRALDAGRPAWLFIDELSCAPPSVQAALLRVVHERAVADLSLAGCRVIAAANPADTAADGGTLAIPMANKMAHVEWTVDAAAWVRGTLSGWGAGVPAAAAKATASVAAFISRHPSALLGTPTGTAWPSPRSWSHAIRMLSAGAGIPGVGACVGSAAASEYAAWETAMDLPDAEEVLAGRAEVPSRGDRAAATLLAVAVAAATERPDRPDRVAAAWGVLGAHRPDVALGAAGVLVSTGEPIAPAGRALAAALRRVGA